CRRVERRRRPAPPLGLLEVLLSPTPRWAWMEPQAGPSRVLRAPPQSAAAHEAPGADTAPSTTGGADAPERDLGTRFHGRFALRRPLLPDAQRPRRGQSRGAC